MIQIRQIPKFQDGQLPVWFYSGTIFEVSFNNLHGIFEILEDDSRSTQPILQGCMSKKVIKLGKIFKKSDICRCESESDERDKSSAANSNDRAYNRDQIVRRVNYAGETS
jgi:hypothetical protein